MKRLLLLSLVNLIVVALTAQSNYQINSDSTAVPFLRISPDSRAGGMGDGGVAYASDANAIHWNLANLAFTKRKMSLAISYTPWLRALVPDINHAYMALCIKPDSVSAIATSLRYFTMGSVNYINGTGGVTTQFKPNEFALDFGYTRMLSLDLSAGITGRYILSNTMLGRVTGQAFSVDVSLAWRGRDRGAITPTAGFCLSNLGTKMWYRDRDTAEFLPTNIRFGGALIFLKTDNHQVTLHGEANRLMAPDPSAVKTLLEKLERITFSVGAEYSFRRTYKFRGGYFHEFKSHGDNRYVTTGVGIEYSVFQLDFSYLIPVGTLRSPLENTLRFTLMFNFDQLKPK